MQREPGFYWVKTHRGKWEVAEWWPNAGWMCCGTDLASGDFEFAAIGDRITPPEEK